MNTYEENTGLESRLEYAVNDLKLKNEELKTNMALMTDEIARLKDILVEREDKWDELMSDHRDLVAYGDRLLDENGDLEERNDASKATIQRLKDELTELEKAYKNECHETQGYKKAWREQRELVALRDEQIAMLERKLTKREEDKN